MPFLNKYGVARHIPIPIIKRGVVDFAVGADWTPAAGDVKISKDLGTAANVTNLPTAITMGNTAVWDFSLTATEMQAAQITVTIADSATKAVEDQSFIVETYGNASAQHPFDLGTAMTAAGIASAVFDENIVSGHSTADTAGLIISQLTKRSVTFSTQAVQGSLLRQLADDGTATFDRTTDSLQAQRDEAPTQSELVNAILDTAIEGSVTFRQMLRLYASALGAKLSGAATTSIKVRDLGDTKDRITATVDTNGNRLVVVLDLT